VEVDAFLGSLVGDVQTVPGLFKANGVITHPLHSDHGRPFPLSPFVVVFLWEASAAPCRVVVILLVQLNPFLVPLLLRQPNSTLGDPSTSTIKQPSPITVHQFIVPSTDTPYLFEGEFGPQHRMNQVSRPNFRRRRRLLNQGKRKY
jgi:hypothetical protein